jgi:hypothetical protein
VQPVEQELYQQAQALIGVGCRLTGEKAAVACLVIC